MNVPSTMAALTGEKVRWRLAELATEAMMVVFAVLVALGVEEWRQERQLRAFADRARAAVDLEIEQNLEQLRSHASDLVEGRDVFRSTLQALRQVQEDPDSFEGESVTLNFSFQFPNLSAAAWRVAQTSQAAPYFDYDWVIERARDYDALELYMGLRNPLMQEFSSLAGMMALNDLDQTVVGMRGLYGRLEVLVQFHEDLQEGMEAYLEERQP